MGSDDRRNRMGAVLRAAAEGNLMRFHVVSLPHTQTTDAYSACAFTEKVRKFCRMMKEMKGHTVYLYAGDDNEAPCDEHISCISEDERAAAVGNNHYCMASFDC